MPGVYVHEGIGNDLTGDGTPSNPWRTISYALANASNGDPIDYYATRMAGNRFNPGIDGYARCWFVDPANGTDGAVYGFQDGADAFATLQYALDQVDCSSGSSAWIFCKDRETVSATVNLDSGSAGGGFKIVEGYSTTPRDGGRYILSGGGTVGTLLQWHNVPGVVLANLTLTGFTSAGMVFGSPSQAGSLSGQFCWNVWTDGGVMGFFSQHASTSPVLYGCGAEDALLYGFFVDAGPAVLRGCYARGCNSSGFESRSWMLAHRCIADSCATGFKGASGGSLVIVDSAAYGCTASGVESTGLVVADGCLATACGDYGFRRQNYALVVNSLAHGNGDGQFEDFAAVDGLLTVDPEMLDPANGDFRLAASSPCHNGGVGMHAVLANQWAHIGPHAGPVTFGSGGHVSQVGNVRGVL